MESSSPGGRGGSDSAQAPWFIEVNGARLACAEQGQGAPVVFLHGAASDHRMWDRHRAIVGQR